MKYHGRSARTPIVSIDRLAEHQNDPWWNPSPVKVDPYDFYHEGPDEEDEPQAPETRERSSPGGSSKAFIARRPRPFQPDPLSAFR